MIDLAAIFGDGPTSTTAGAVPPPVPAVAEATKGPEREPPAALQPHGEPWSDAQAADVTGEPWSGLDFTRWVRRPDCRGRMGWERLGLTEWQRWWARDTFEDTRAARALSGVRQPGVVGDFGGHLAVSALRPTNGGNPAVGTRGGNPAPAWQGRADRRGGNVGRLEKADGDLLT